MIRNYNSTKRALIPECARCHIRAGLRCVHSAKLLNVHKGPLSRFRRFKSGLQEWNKKRGFQGQAGKGKYTPKALQIQREKRAKENQIILDSLPNKLIISQYNSERKKLARLEMQWASYHRIAVNHKQGVNDRIRRNTNPTYKALFYCRKRVREFCKQRQYQKRFSTADMTGCSPAQLRAHLEAQFRDGMTWQNHGPVWHIDHIFPLAKATDIEHVKRLCHYTNLQPLLAHENLTKGCK